MKTAIRNARTRLLLAAVLCVFLSALLLWAVANQRQRVEFADGSSLEWMGLTKGTNALLHGSLVEQLLGNRIPANGINLGGLKLRRPNALRAYEEEAPLTAWIRLKGPDLQRNNRFHFYWEGSRATTANSSGREIAIPPARPLGGRVTNENILFIPLYAFPRDERTVRLRISPPGDNPEERAGQSSSLKIRFMGKLRIGSHQHFRSRMLWASMNLF